MFRDFYSGELLFEQYWQDKRKRSRYSLSRKYIRTNRTLNKFFLEGIIYSRTNPKVLIKGDFYYLGDSICDGVITGISANKVKIKFQDGEKYFKLGNRIK